MDKIKIKGLEFFAYHGVLKSEQELGQLFSLDCEIFLNTELVNDDLCKTVNYAEVSCEIVEYCKNNRFDLLETLANNLAKYILLKFNSINKITITIHKPHAPIPTKFSDVSIEITRGWNTCYLAIGSNLGNKKENLDFAYNSLKNNPYINCIKKSEYIETKPYGVTDQPDFLNGAIKIETILTPLELLDFCQEIEKNAGRVKTRHWGERTLDIDILTYENINIFTDKLKIPHPEMHKRDFVLKPLCEIEPYLIHPTKKINVSELLENVLEENK